MRVYAQWFGGSSYAVPEADDYETFASLSDAIDAFESRADFDPYCPCVDESTEMLVWFGEPEGEFPCDGAHNYPDRRIYLGPRGGTRVEHC